MNSVTAQRVLCNYCQRPALFRATSIHIYGRDYGRYGIAGPVMPMSDAIQTGRPRARSQRSRGAKRERLRMRCLIRFGRTGSSPIRTPPHRPGRFAG